MVETFKRKLHQSTTTKKVHLIIFLFLSISFILVATLWIQGEVFNGVRSYIRGEGLWAKAQKDAIAYLDRYSHTHNINDYHAFLDSIKVNHGDQKARLAMNQKPVDYDNAVQGFLEGNNAPEDIDSMIWFYLNFRQISYLQEAIRIWEEADHKIAELVSLASQIHNLVQQQNFTDMDELRQQLYTLNDTLLILENDFSNVLGEGARWVNQTTWIAGISILFLFSALAFLISKQILSSISIVETRLRVRESQFRALKESNTIGIIHWTLEGCIDDANDYFLNMLGFTQDDLKAGLVNWLNLTPSDCRERDFQAIQELMDMGRCEPYEKELYSVNGNRVPVYLGASLIDDSNDHGIAFFMDLREKKQQEEQLKLSAAVFDVSHDGIIITDNQFSVISVNRAVIDITGFDEEEIIGHTPSLLRSNHNHVDEIYNELQLKGFWQGDLIDSTKEKKTLPIHVSINTIKDRFSNISHYVFILFDITESKAREKKLKHLANHDKLTGLSNREHLEYKFHEAINKAIDNNNHVALLFFDLDQFKPINDTYGHDTGDELLKIVAGRLNRHIRQSDTVARIGGDEFIILLEPLNNRKRAEEIVIKTLKELSMPIMINGHEIKVTASVGLSLYPDDGSDMKTLMEHADREMYHNKSGKKC